MKAKTLTDNKQQIVNADAAIKAAHELKRKLIEQSKVIVYTNISELYGLEGQALLDAVTKEHTLINKFTESGMTYNEIEELADDDDNSSDDDETDGQTSFFSEERNPYAV